MIDCNGFVADIGHGVDPYNTTAPVSYLTNYNGPLTVIAYRCQQSWDFAPGSQLDKLQYYQQHGMHRLPLRVMPSEPLPAFLRRQAE